MKQALPDEVTRKMHALATSPEGALLTLAELERLAEDTLTVERETHECTGEVML